MCVGVASTTKHSSLTYKMIKIKPLLKYSIQKLLRLIRNNCDYVRHTRNAEGMKVIERALLINSELQFGR